MLKIGSDFNEIGVSCLLSYHLNVLSQYFNVLYCGRFTILDLPINLYGHGISPEVFLKDCFHWNFMKTI